MDPFEQLQLLDLGFDLLARGVVVEPLDVLDLLDLILIGRVVKIVVNVVLQIGCEIENISVSQLVVPDKYLLVLLVILLDDQEILTNGGFFLELS